MSACEENVAKSHSLKSSASNDQTVGHEYWELDASVTHCRGCNAEFGTFKWKHHCRACGKVFCDSCTTARIAVHRSHYTENAQKMKRVCGQCALHKDEAMKFLETVKERAHLGCVSAAGFSVGKGQSLPISTCDVDEEDLDDSALYMAALEPSEVCQARPAAHATLGLPRIIVNAVDHDKEHFYFDPKQWVAMIEASESTELDFKTFNVTQLRGGRRIWSGWVTVKHTGTCYSCRRSVTNAHNQWQVGDTIIRACDEHRAWNLEDAIQLGTEISMFDDTLLRLDVNDYPSVTLALKSLNARTLSCPEGICLVHSSSQRQYFLLVREDRKLQGSYLFDGFKNWDEKSKHKFWWRGA